MKNEFKRSRHKLDSKRMKRKKPETSSSSSSEDEDSPVQSVPVELTDKQRKALKKAVADDTPAKKERKKIQL